MRRCRVLLLLLAVGLSVASISTQGADLLKAERRNRVSMPDWSQLRRVPVSTVIQRSVGSTTVLLGLPTRVDQGRAEIAAMAPEMQRLVWLSVLADRWGKDGLHTFFFLRGGNFAPEVAESLTKAGLDHHATIFAEAMALFGEPYPVEEKERDLLFGWSQPWTRTDAGTMIPAPLNALDHALMDLGVRFGTKEAYWAAVEDYVRRTPSLDAWLRKARLEFPDEERLLWLAEELEIPEGTRFPDSIRVWPRPYQILLLLHVFEMEMLNGGVNQFFYNPSGDAAREVVAALREAGLRKHATAVLKGISLFRSPFPRDTERRRRQFAGKQGKMRDKKLYALTGVVDDGAIREAMMKVAKGAGILPE